MGSSAEERVSAPTRSSTVNTSSEQLTPLGCTGQRDTCRATGLLGPAGFPTCHPVSNGTSGHFQHLAVPQPSCQACLPAALPAPWEAAQQEGQGKSTPPWNGIQGDPSRAQPAAGKAPCADGSCCRGRHPWDSYCQRDFAQPMARLTLTFAVPRGNFLSWLLESWKTPRDISEMLHALTPCRPHLRGGGYGCQQQLPAGCVC